jgi:signal transduction histidine kinase
MGLSIIKAIVTAHGGQVRVESFEGKGMRFFIEAPVSGEESE